MIRSTEGKVWNQPPFNGPFLFDDYADWRTGWRQNAGIAMRESVTETHRSDALPVATVAVVKPARSGIAD
jgi:hypothetical protein